VLSSRIAKTRLRTEARALLQRGWAFWERCPCGRAADHLGWRALSSRHRGRCHRKPSLATRAVSSTADRRVHDAFRHRCVPGRERASLGEAPTHPRNGWQTGVSRDPELTAANHALRYVAPGPRPPPSRGRRTPRALPTSCHTGSASPHGSRWPVASAADPMEMRSSARTWAGPRSRPKLTSRRGQPIRLSFPRNRKGAVASTRRAYRLRHASSDPCL
jgi:hypothetical protein